MIRKIKIKLKKKKEIKNFKNTTAGYMFGKLGYSFKYEDKFNGIQIWERKIHNFNREETDISTITLQLKNGTIVYKSELKTKDNKIIPLSSVLTMNELCAINKAFFEYGYGNRVGFYY